MIAVSGEGKGRGVKAAALFALAIVVVSGLVGAILLAAPTNTNRFYGGGLSLAAGGDGFSIGSDTVLSRAAANSWALGAGDTLTIPTLTSGRIPITGTGGLLGDDADLTWTGGDTLNVANISTSSLYVNSNLYYPKGVNSYIIWNTTGTIYARNENTGVITSGADADVLLQTLITSNTNAYLKTGEYSLSTYLNINAINHFVLTGDRGVTLKAINNNDLIRIQDSSFIEIEKITLDGNSISQTGGRGIYIQNCVDVKLIDLDIRNISSTGVYAIGTAGGGTTLYYDNVYVQNTTYFGLYFNGYRGITILNCVAEKINTAGYTATYFEDCGVVSINQLWCESLKDVGIGLHGTTGVVLSGCTIIDADDKAISLSDASTGNTFIDVNTISTTGATSLSLTAGCDNNNFIGGNIDKAVSNGGANNRFIGIPTYITENDGSTTIPAGNTSITVAHVLSATPDFVLIEPSNNPQGASYYVSNFNSTHFTIYLWAGAPVGGLNFKWYARIP